MAPPKSVGAGQLTSVPTREQVDTTMLGSALPMVPCFGLERLLLSRESAQRSYLPIHRRAISKLIQVISPHLHHLDALQTTTGTARPPPDQLRSGRTEIDSTGLFFPQSLAVSCRFVYPKCTRASSTDLATLPKCLILLVPQEGLEPPTPSLRIRRSVIS